VAELADAQDLGFCATYLPKRNNRFQRFQRLYKRQGQPHIKLCCILPKRYNGKVTDKLKKIAASVALGFLLLCLSAHAQERKTFTIPFHMEKGYILLHTTVNRKPALLVLDTGAPVSVTKDARRLLSLKENNSISFFFHFDDWVSVAFQIPSVRYDGLLGNDLLKQFRRVTIDYKAQTVTLED
jgi:hypothetical protein